MDPLILFIIVIAIMAAFLGAGFMLMKSKVIVPETKSKEKNIKKKNQQERKEKTAKKQTMPLTESLTELLGEEIEDDTGFTEYATGILTDEELEESENKARSILFESGSLAGTGEIIENYDDSTGLLSEDYRTELLEELESGNFKAPAIEEGTTLLGESPAQAAPQYVTSVAKSTHAPSNQKNTYAPRDVLLKETAKQAASVIPVEKEEMPAAEAGPADPEERPTTLLNEELLEETTERKEPDNASFLEDATEEPAPAEEILAEETDMEEDMTSDDAEEENLPEVRRESSYELPGVVIHQSLNGFKYQETEEAPLFIGCNIAAADFSEKNLAGAKFINCSIKESSFLDADLTGALFESTNFEESNFKFANLADAKVIGCCFKKCSFMKSDFENAFVEGTIFSSCTQDKKTSFENAVIKNVEIAETTDEFTFAGAVITEIK